MINLRPQESSQEREAGILIAVALVRAIHSIQGSLVSMGTALLAFAGPLGWQDVLKVQRKIGGK